MPLLEDADRWCDLQPWVMGEREREKGHLTFDLVAVGVVLDLVILVVFVVKDLGGVFCAVLVVDRDNLVNSHGEELARA